MSFADYTVDENISRYITRLDQVAVDYESRWGVGRLEKIVSPEMLNKWESQKEKLEAAVHSSDLSKVVALVEGSIRGWEAMEADAIRLGHKPSEPDFIEVKHPENGDVFRIIKNNYDYDNAIDGEAHVFTLQEVARILSNHAVIKDVKSVFPDAKVVKMGHKVDFFNDNLPF